MDRPQLSLKNKLVKLHVIVLVFLFLTKLLFFETGDGKAPFCVIYASVRAPFPSAQNSRAEL
jgi:hypothetical protein